MKKFAENAVTKITAWIKCHGVEVGLLLVILSKVFGWL